MGDKINLQEFKALMDYWNGNHIAISKTERDDYDQTILQLSDISYSHHERTDGEGYQSEFTIHFQGNGEIVTDNTLTTLPTASYDIPINELYDYHYDGLRFYFKTDRGSYMISRLP
ncbi:hypothetical protein [Bacillus taeanensis]|uniref:Uncharacterized protein n=1 Tax=Bacillus taeanensis TaxID=273032 RepID=A0A366XT89_9BACI|nr:hypothetical protein [Bacillus taeanensis]RBW69362.1 hypothetical protein DS031_12050 [Bacillus taeanensis]